MQITITNDGIEVTEALKQYISKKLKKLEHFTDKTPSVHVTLSQENLEKVVKARMSIHGIELNAHAKNKDLYAAIDALSDKMELQINKHKQKEKEKRRDKSEQFDIEKDSSKER